MQPHLAHMGEATHCGAVSFGQVVKALNNMVVFMTANALAEAITIGRRAGIDAKLLFETMSKGSSDSAVLRTGGLKHLVPEHFPEDAFPTDYALKDISLALELAARRRRQGAGRAAHARPARSHQPRRVWQELLSRDGEDHREGVRRSSLPGSTRQSISLRKRRWMRGSSPRMTS